MSMNPYQAYKNTAVQTASPAKLLLMLFDGLLSSLENAGAAIREGFLEDANRQLIKAQNIVLELRSSLKMEYEVSQSLESLYDYYYRCLVDANVQKNEQILSELRPLIQGLRDTWYQASLQVQSAQHLGGEQIV